MNIDNYLQTVMKIRSSLQQLQNAVDTIQKAHPSTRGALKEAENKTKAILENINSYEDKLGLLHSDNVENINSQLQNKASELDGLWDDNIHDTTVRSQIEEFLGVLEFLRERTPAIVRDVVLPMWQSSQKTASSTITVDDIPDVDPELLNVSQFLGEASVPTDQSVDMQQLLNKALGSSAQISGMSNPPKTPSAEVDNWQDDFNDLSLNVLSQEQQVAPWIMHSSEWKFTHLPTQVSKYISHSDPLIYQRYVASLDPFTDIRQLVWATRARLFWLELLSAANNNRSQAQALYQLQNPLTDVSSQLTAVVEEHKRRKKLVIGPARQEKTTHSDKTLKCWNCGKIGHKEKDCLSKKKDGASKVTPSNQYN